MVRNYFIRNEREPRGYWIGRKVPKFLILAPNFKTGFPKEELPNKGVGLWGLLGDLKFFFKGQTKKLGQARKVP